MDVGDAFAMLLLAAMKDAAIELKTSQLFIEFDPFEGKALPVYKRKVRLIIVPEEIEHKRRDGKPYGSPP